MSFIDDMKNKARTSIKTIVLPESEDLRTLKAVQMINEQGFAKVILIGNPEKIALDARDNHIDLGDTPIINNLNSDKLDYYANSLAELRKNKGMTYDEAMELLKTNSRYFATMMVKMGDADGFVSGACHSTADTLKPALQIIKGAPGIPTVSAFFVMVLPETTFGDNGVFIYADSGMNENPDSEALSDIAISSANSYKELVNPEGTPRVAMLSYSTKGSAHSELTDKVIDATNKVRAKAPDLIVDGELQLDAAIIPEVAKFKAPGSPVEGKANILIFPNLDVGNICYKMTQRLGHAEAYGPLCQGMARPVNDLSRGCSAEDIVGVVAITAVQAINQK